MTYPRCQICVGRDYGETIEDQFREQMRDGTPTDTNFISLLDTYEGLKTKSVIGAFVSVIVLNLGMSLGSLYLIVAGVGFLIMFLSGMNHAEEKIVSYIILDNRKLLTVVRNPRP